MAGWKMQWGSGSRVFGGLLLGALAAAGAARSEGAGGSAVGRPNVLMVVIDDLNDWVGCLGGHPDAKTPNLDRFAERGRLFTNAHCSAPMCAPSRASVMTGLQPWTTGYYYNTVESFQELPPYEGVATMQEYFQAQGYYTISGGKILHPAKGRRGRAADEGLGKGRRKTAVRDRSRIQGVPGAEYGSPYGDEEDYPDQRLAREAAEALQREFDQPFFLSVGFKKPHKPYYAPERWFALHDKAAIRLPKVLGNDREDLPPNFDGPVSGYEKFGWLNEDADRWREYVHAYLATSSFVDHCVGIVLEALAASPHKENTIVVIWSDHGYHLGEKEHFFKCTLWEESTRNYLAFAGPGVVPGKPSARPVSLVDIYPTLVQLCGLPEPTRLDGVSLVPLLEDPEAPREQPAVMAIREGNFAVRSEEYRYIRYADGAEELYHLTEDPHEWKNLAADPAFAETKEALRRSIPENPAPMLGTLPRNDADFPRPAARQNASK